MEPAAVDFDLEGEQQHCSRCDRRHKRWRQLISDLAGAVPLDVRDIGLRHRAFSPCSFAAEPTSRDRFFLSTLCAHDAVARAARQSPRRRGSSSFFEDDGRDARQGCRNKRPDRRAPRNLVAAPS